MTDQSPVEPPAGPPSLEEQLATIFNGLATELRQQQQKNMSELQAQFEQLKPLAAPPPPPPSPEPSRSQPEQRPRGKKHGERSASLPDPTPFSGQRDDLLRWQAQVWNKLSFNHDHFPTEESKISYAFSRLEGAAAQQVLPFIFTSEQTSQFKTFDELSRCLDHAFGDPNRRVTAQAKLYSLRQRNKEFATHLAEFQTLAADSGYDSEAKKSILHRGLSVELLKGLNHVPASEINTYEKFVSRCLELDNNIRATNALLSSDRDRSARTFPPQHVPGRQLTGYVSETGPEPMDLSGTGSRKALSANEREERFRNRLCLYCGKPGHFKINCPNRHREGRPSSARIASVLAPDTSNFNQPTFLSDQEN